MEGKKNRNLKLVIAFLCIFYTVGIAGLLFPATQSIFQNLVPFSLILSCALIILFQEDLKKTSILFFVLLYLFSFLIEVIGVKTGKIFGTYSYGNTLGFKVFETPLVIGLNWLMLIICCGNFINQIGILKPWKELTGAAILTGLDLFIEPVAIHYNWWYWQSNAIPLQNYVAWFYLSFIMLLFFNYTGLKPNKVALTVMIIQFLFFVILNFAVVTS